MIIIFVIIIIIIIVLLTIIISFVVAGTANAGFNVVLTALINIGWVVGAYYVVKNSKTPIAIGFLIGSSSGITFLNLMTAIFWGQLSKCKAIALSIAQYTCTNTTAYGAVCAFAVFIFLTQLTFTSSTILWRGELINETGLYDEMGHSSRGSGYEQVKSGSFSSPPPSADL